MKKLQSKTIAIVLTFVFLFSMIVPTTGCMSDKDYRLRKKEIEAKAAHPATYEVLKITGPFELKNGATIVAASPTQPWKDTPIPDGMNVQKAVIRDVITGAIIGYCFYQVGHSKGDTTNTYNYSEGTTPAP